MELYDFNDVVQDAGRIAELWAFETENAMNEHQEIQQKQKEAKKVKKIQRF